MMVQILKLLADNAAIKRCPSPKKHKISANSKLNAPSYPEAKPSSTELAKGSQLGIYVFRGLGVHIEQ